MAIDSRFAAFLCTMIFMLACFVYAYRYSNGYDFIFHRKRRILTNMIQVSAEVKHQITELHKQPTSLQVSGSDIYVDAYGACAEINAFTDIFMPTITTIDRHRKAEEILSLGQQQEFELAESGYELQKKQREVLLKGDLRLNKLNHQAEVSESNYKVEKAKCDRDIAHSMLRTERAETELFNAKYKRKKRKMAKQKKVEEANGD